MNMQAICTSSRSFTALENENARLRQQVAELKRAICEDFFPPDWLRIAPRELAILSVLLKRKSTATAETLVSIIYNDADAVDPKGIESHVSKLRKKLRPVGVEIKNRRGLGYWIEPADKVKLRAAVESLETSQ